MKELKLEKSERGFYYAKFVDRYGNVCSLQKSSLATEDCIWLGVDESQLTVFEDETKGKYITTKMPDNFSVDTRMHLTQAQVAAMLPYLIAFVETGELV